ncbi:MAG TPA: NADH-quinone oxidoreductase, partial [Acetobacteraceae bacterium]|nr:NADH-quinone oxidoreductase [Acetobacteraceae bacterium]
MTVADLIRAGSAEPCRPWPRHVLDPAAWGAMAAALESDASLDLLALWADTTSVHALFLDA